jgi:hypothetical protein
MRDRGGVRRRGRRVHLLLFPSVIFIDAMAMSLGPYYLLWTTRRQCMQARETGHDVSVVVTLCRQSSGWLGPPRGGGGGVRGGGHISGGITFAREVLLLKFVS